MAGTTWLYLFPVLIVLALLLAAGGHRLHWALRHDPDPRPDWRIAAFDTGRDAFIGGVVFVLIGPLLGYLQLFVMLLIAGEIENPFHLAGHSGFLIFAYLLGSIPALLTGLLAGMLKPWLRGWKGALSMAGAGIAMTWLAWAIPVLHAPGARWGQALLNLAIVAPLGGLSALLCTRLWLRFSRPA